MRHGKKYRDAAKGLDRDDKVGIDEAIAWVKAHAGAKFTETVEFAARLGVDPRKTDQMVRGTVSLPHGTGKTVRVLVLARGEKEREAKEAGADYVGFEDYLQKIREGWTDFDACIATPDGMGEVGKLGKVLGPRGLMPNPKSGTVTMDVARAVRDLKAGKIEYRVDKGANIHAPVGKVNFEASALAANTRALLAELMRAKPSSAKGTYIRSITLSSTMGPGVRIDVGRELAAMK
jgi:large subunit ribosomal protein L1